MTLSKNLRKTLYLGLSAVMIAGLGAGATSNLSANASHRHHHNRYARRAHLSRRERRARHLHADYSRVKPRIQKLYRQVRHAGYSRNQTIAILANAGFETHETFRASRHHGYLRVSSRHGIVNQLKSIKDMDNKGFKSYHNNPDILAVEYQDNFIQPRHQHNNAMVANVKLVKRAVKHEHVHVHASAYSHHRHSHHSHMRNEGHHHSHMRNEGHNLVIYR